MTKLVKYKENLRIDGNRVISYDTVVATIDRETNTLTELGKWSPTTSKHVNYVAAQLGLRKVAATKGHWVMPKLKKYPPHCRQSIVFSYKPPTNTRWCDMVSNGCGQRWTVATSGGCPIPESLQNAPYQGTCSLEPWLLAWGLAIAKALEWDGKWVLGHVGDGKYILTQCGTDNPTGWVRKRV